MKKNWEISSSPLTNSIIEGLAATTNQLWSGDSWPASRGHHCHHVHLWKIEGSESVPVRSYMLLVQWGYLWISQQVKSGHLHIFGFHVKFSGSDPVNMDPVCPNCVWMFLAISFLMARVTAMRAMLDVLTSRAIWANINEPAFIHYSIIIPLYMRLKFNPVSNYHHILWLNEQPVDHSCCWLYVVPSGNLT
jgi:hypothetical protein